MDRRWGLLNEMSGRPMPIQTSLVRSRENEATSFLYPILNKDFGCSDHTPPYPAGLDRWKK